MKHVLIVLTLISSLAMTSCSKPSPGDEDTLPTAPINENIPTTEYDVTQLSFVNVFDFTPIVNKVERQDYNELSGIASSHQNKGLLYMHNDKKNSPIVITNTEGTDLGKIVLDGQSSLDPEDICVGPGPEIGKSYIYFADIGDNNTVRSSITVYRFEEPVLNNPTDKTEIHMGNISKIILKYPKGAYNAETLMIDPLTRDLYIATKETNRSAIYRASYPKYEQSETILEPLLNMRFFDKLTSGDISADGKEILLRNKSQVWYWQRKDGQSIVDVLLTAPKKAPYAGNEHQGEGVGFAHDGKGYFTNSETRDYPGAVSNISFYIRK